MHHACREEGKEEPAPPPPLPPSLRETGCITQSHARTPHTCMHGTGYVSWFVLSGLTPRNW
jgi:hypothetical protein